MKLKKVTNEVSIEKIVKGFANKKRIDIIYLLNDKPGLSVADISEELNIEFKNASAHIGKLAGAGILFKKSLGNLVTHFLTKRGKSILQFVRIIE